MKMKSFFTAALITLAAMSSQSLLATKLIAPRETMRGKMALLGYLYGIRK